MQKIVQILCVIITFVFASSGRADQETGKTIQLSEISKIEMDCVVGSLTMTIKSDKFTYIPGYPLSNTAESSPIETRTSHQRTLECLALQKAILESKTIFIEHELDPITKKVVIKSLILTTQRLSEK